jgi:hypothetical protein
MWCIYHWISCVMSTSQGTKMPQQVLEAAKQSTVANSFTFFPICFFYCIILLETATFSPTDRINSSFLFKDLCVSYVRHCGSILVSIS